MNWSDMAGMRDVLIHHYFGIDHDIVWDVLVNEIPILHQELRHIIGHEGS